MSSPNRSCFSCDSLSSCCTISISIPKNVRVVFVIQGLTVCPPRCRSWPNSLGTSGRSLILADGLQQSHPGSGRCDPLLILRQSTPVHPQSIKDFWSGSRPKRQHTVYIDLVLPSYPKPLSILGSFDVDLCNEGPLPQSNCCIGHVMDRDISHRTYCLVDCFVGASSFRV